MRKLAIYYLSPDGERQKYEIDQPTEDMIEHYAWVSEYVKNHREGHSVGLFGARRVIPDQTDRRDWLLDRHGMATVRTEEAQHATSKQLEIDEEDADEQH